jgi:hypothetical protein
LSRLSKRKFISHLNRLDKQDIIDEVVQLFNKFSVVKEYYKAELAGEANPLLAKYKMKIEKAYAAPNPKERTTNINLNRLISGFKKISVSEYDTIDLMLHRVECGLEAVKRNNRRTATFYRCIISTFDEAMELMKPDIVWEEHRERIMLILAASEVGRQDLTARLEALLRR